MAYFSTNFSTVPEILILQVSPKLINYDNHESYFKVSIAVYFWKYFRSWMCLMNFKNFEKVQYGNTV